MLRMGGRRLLCGFLLVGACAVAGAAQKTAGAVRIPYDGSDSLTGPMPIHVDQNCRILPDAAVTGHKKPHPYTDPAICSLQSTADSEHWEEKISGKELLRTFVRVREHTFVLQDVADQPVMFIVQQPVSKGWFVDSDPQPWQMGGDTAYFRVYVKPGQTVRLHVGERREWPQKPKPI